MRSTRGFTLIELLVVIAIIGILSSVVLASLNSARQKSRDARRVSDLKQIKIALELYSDSCGAQYPATLVTTTANGCPSGTTFGTFMATVPADPSGGGYGYLLSAATGPYYLGALLESAGQTGPLVGDFDGSALMPTVVGQRTTGVNCNANAGGATEAIYCVTN